MTPLPEKFLRTSGVETRTMDRAAVLVAPGEHRYFALTRVGARIWELLAQPRTVAELVAILMGEFTVGEAECRQHTEEFLRQLAGRKLVARAA